MVAEPDISVIEFDNSCSLAKISMVAEPDIEIIGKNDKL